MKTYRIILGIQSGLLTPLQADTIFGHLCWVVAHENGDEALREFIEPFITGNPPFVISDGFPVDMVPKPFSVEMGTIDPVERKELKKVDYVGISNFNQIRGGGKVRIQAQQIHVKKSLSVHNSINRITNTTLAEGGIYSLPETHIGSVAVYLKASSERWKDRVVELFQGIAKVGYGRKKSIGKGRLVVERADEFDGFSEVPGANAFVSLSHFCPDRRTPIDGVYRVFVKYGVLGEEFNSSGNPFKRPLLMFQAGSVFRTGNAPMDYYGRMVKNVSPIKREVVQYGYAFAVPLVLGSI